MANSKFLEVLFSTKNYSKILKEYNKLSFVEKQIILSNDKVKHRLYKIIDIELLISMLIDLPFEFRINFLRGIDYQKFCKNYEKVIIEFLQLQNYDNFDYQKLSCFEEIKEKSILTLIFRKLSVDKLKMIIIQNYYQFLNDYAFIEYSKKNPSLSLESSIMNNISDNVLISELKRRTRQKCITLIDMTDFLKFEPDKQNSILVNGNIESLEDKFIDIYQARYSNFDVTKKTLIFLVLLKDLNYLKLLELQTIIYNLDDENSREMMKIFFKVVCKFECEVDDKYLNSMIFNFRKLNAKTKELYKVIKMKPFSILYYLNTGILDDEVEKFFNKTIRIEQYQKTNIKKINKLTRSLDLMLDNEEDKPQKNNITILAYKLYYIFGYENSIELLNQKFGSINVEMLSKLLDKCDIKDVGFQKTNGNYEPEINSDFIRFLIGDKKDNNTTIKRMLRGELDLLVSEFPNLYNNFERVQQAIGKKIHLNKLIPLLEENPFMLSPNEYKMTKDIIDNIIKSYGYKDVFGDENNENNITSMDSKECIIEACNFYHNYLEKRVVSTIPRVYGVTEDNYKYEVLKLDDPIIMTLGYQTGCCFRLNGMSKEFLRYCSESLYARVIVIRNENNEICAMIPVIRNGNVIAGNSIERNSKGEDLKIYNALKIAFNGIISISTQYEENPLIAGCVTNLHSNVETYSNHPINQKIFPIRNNSFYTNYESQAYVVSILPGKSENDFELYLPTAIYFDERPSILDYHWGINDISIKNEVEKRIKSINYQLNIPEEKFLFSKYIICSEDWYINVGYEGVIGECLEKDPRAIEEFNSIKNHLESNLQGKKLYEIEMSDLALDDSGFNSAKSRQLVLKRKTTDKV